MRPIKNKPKLQQGSIIPPLPEESHPEDSFLIDHFTRKRTGADPTVEHDIFDYRPSKQYSDNYIKSKINQLGSQEAFIAMLNDPKRGKGRYRFDGDRLMQAEGEPIGKAFESSTGEWYSTGRGEPIGLDPKLRVEANQDPTYNTKNKQRLESGGKLSLRPSSKGLLLK